uniref:Uncharacterized protein n=1 Tax=Timema bartmani TaxID=61472 RepID=A0A7R9HVS8_9NEOP|nr:unnamed protein product [Timema bartmani]
MDPKLFSSKPDRLSNVSAGAKFISSSSIQCPKRHDDCQGQQARNRPSLHAGTTHELESSAATHGHALPCFPKWKQLQLVHQTALCQCLRVRSNAHLQLPETTHSESQLKFSQLTSNNGLEVAVVGIPNAREKFFPDTKESQKLNSIFRVTRHVHVHIVVGTSHYNPSQSSHVSYLVHVVYQLVCLAVYPLVSATRPSITFSTNMRGCLAVEPNNDTCDLCEQYRHQIQVTLTEEEKKVIKHEKESHKSTYIQLLSDMSTDFTIRRRLLVYRFTLSKPIADSRNMFVDLDICLVVILHMCFFSLINGFITVLAIDNNNSRSKVFTSIVISNNSFRHFTRKQQTVIVTTVKGLTLRRRTLTTNEVVLVFIFRHIVGHDDRGRRSANISLSNLCLRCEKACQPTFRSLIEHISRRVCNKPTNVSAPSIDIGLDRSSITPEIIAAAKTSILGRSKYTCICVEGDWKTILEKPHFSTPDRDSNLNFPIIGTLVYCESCALEHTATEECRIHVNYRCTQHAILLTSCAQYGTCNGTQRYHISFLLKLVLLLEMGRAAPSKRGALRKLCLLGPQLTVTPLYTYRLDPSTECQSRRDGQRTYKGVLLCSCYQYCLAHKGHHHNVGSSHQGIRKSGTDKSTARRCGMSRVSILGLQRGQQTSEALPLAEQSQGRSLHDITPFMHSHSRQRLLVGLTVAPLLTSFPSKLQPEILMHLICSARATESSLCVETPGRRMTKISDVITGLGNHGYERLPPMRCSHGVGCGVLVLSFCLLEP